MGEKVRFAFGDLGCNLIWGLVGSFLTLYYTDSALIAAGTAGTVMMFARFLDGLSDLLMGVIIEKTHSRFGKARPWVLWASLPLIISVILAFHVPAGLSPSGKVVYIAVTYTIMSAVTYTAVNMAYMSMFTLFAPDTNDRNVAATVRTLFAMVTSLAVGALTMPLITSFGGAKMQSAWNKVTLLYGAIAFVCLLITFFGVKEKQISGAGAGEPGTEETKVPLKQVFKVLAKSKYFYLAALLSICYYLCNGVSGVNVYYARDVLGDVNLVGMIGLVFLPTMIIASILAPVLYKKYGKKRIMSLGAVITAVSCVAQLLDPANVVLFLAMLAVKGFGLMLYGAAIGTLPGDVCDWSEWKQGVRAEGVVTSIGSFGSKVGSGLGTGLVGVVLALGKYDGSLVSQASTAINAEIVLMIGVPIILGVIELGLLAFWDMDKVHPGIMSALKTRREKVTKS